VETRPFTADDAAAVEAFLARIPGGESAFFKEDISVPGVVKQWIEGSPTTLRTLAWDGDEVVGYTAVIRGVGCRATSARSGWSSIRAGAAPV